MSIYVPDEQPGDSLGWSKWYGVFSISRLYLRSIGFSTESINLLTDEDMQRIADTYNNRNFIAFEEDIKFLVACEITEKQANLLNAAFPISHVTREDLIAANFPKEVVEQISDEDMQAIARTMGDMHVEYGGYWEDLSQAVKKILQEENE